MTHASALAVFLAFLSAGSALAQSSPDPAAAEGRVRAVAERVEAEAACLGRVQSELRRVIRLMEEAQAQMAAPRATERDRADARAAIVSLAQRAIEIERGVPACRQALSAEARSGAPVGGVVTRRTEPGPEARAVATENPATAVVERDVPLTDLVGVVVAERVDGAGSLEAETVRGAIRSVGHRLSQCYEAIAGNGALREGTIILTFTVSSSGQISRVETDRSSFPARFTTCIRDAGRRIHVDRAPVGGDVAYSYTLRFPAS
jgi:hypothetical protein